MLQREWAIAVLMSTIAGTVWAQTDRKAKVENDQTRFRESTTWIYNDLTKGMASAKLANKPVLAVLRCIP